MALPPQAVGASYRKALLIGLSTSALQLIVLSFFVLSRTLVAYTLHSLLDFATLAGTTLLLSRNWTSEAAFDRSKHRWLQFGVWTLGLGGFAIGFEALFHIVFGAPVETPPAWPLLAIALFGAAANWTMHSILEGAESHGHEALHKNNLDHIFWDMILSLLVFVSGMFMWLLETAAVDHWFALGVGFLVLPYLAWKRWHERDHAECHHHH